MPLSQLEASDFERPDVLFADGEYTYSTSGKCLAQGGTGNVWLLTRWLTDHPAASSEAVVAKTFRDEFLLLVREDATARRHFQHNLQVVSRLRSVQHPNIVPVLLTAPIRDNHMIVTPLVGESLLGVLAAHSISAQDRALLLLDAIRGLAALHSQGVIHRDFTLHNILTLGEPVGPGIGRHAALFDFDLTLCPSLLGESSLSYVDYYQGRIAGSPEYSVAPELIDDNLGKQALSPRIDVYAIGTSLYNLFTNEPLYGEAPDLATLLFRISQGVVHHGQSSIRYPDEVPQMVRPLIETCLERDPEARLPDACAVLKVLEELAPQLPGPESRGRYRTTMGYVHPERKGRQEAIFAERTDESVTFDEIRRIDLSLGRYGYVLEKSLGRVKSHPIFLAQPDPVLLAAGRFPEDNTYRKIVTSIEVAARPDGAGFVQTWLGRVRPIVERVRQGMLTSLYRAVHDRPSGQLLLFSEYVSQAHFGTELARFELTLEEAFGLALIVAQSVARLHAEGLAHNNVCPESLLFKGQRETAEVRPMLVGLVEPSFEPAALEEDVRRLAALIIGFIRPSRIEALHGEARTLLAALREGLARTASGQGTAPSLSGVIDALANGLGALDRNFQLLRRHDGNTAAYADLLIRYSLYHRFYG